jgi:hypothetical protein
MTKQDYIKIEYEKQKKETSRAFLNWFFNFHFSYLEMKGTGWRWFWIIFSILMLPFGI